MTKHTNLYIKGDRDEDISGYQWKCLKRSHGAVRDDHEDGESRSRLWTIAASCFIKIPTLNWSQGILHWSAIHKLPRTLFEGILELPVENRNLDVRRFNTHRRQGNRSTRPTTVPRFLSGILPSCLVQLRGPITPTYPQSKLTFNLDDYGKQGSITPRVSDADCSGERLCPSHCHTGEWCHEKRRGRA